MILSALNTHTLKSGTFCIYVSNLDLGQSSENYFRKLGNSSFT